MLGEINTGNDQLWFFPQAAEKNRQIADFKAGKPIATVWTRIIMYFLATTYIWLCNLLHYAVLWCVALLIKSGLSAEDKLLKVNKNKELGNNRFKAGDLAGAMRHWYNVSFITAVDYTQNNTLHYSLQLVEYPSQPFSSLM